MESKEKKKQKHVEPHKCVGASLFQLVSSALAQNRVSGKSLQKKSETLGVFITVRKQARTCFYITVSFASILFISYFSDLKCEKRQARHVFQTHQPWQGDDTWGFDSSLPLLCKCGIKENAAGKGLKINYNILPRDIMKIQMDYVNCAC